MRNFRKLNVWNDSRVLVKDIYTLTSLLPSSEKFCLASQINRCVISIPTNIAEGSAYELESHIILCSDLNLIDENKLSLVIDKIQVLQMRISSLIKYNKSKL